MTHLDVELADVVKGFAEFTRHAGAFLPTGPDDAVGEETLRSLWSSYADGGWLAMGSDDEGTESLALRCHAAFAAAGHETPVGVPLAEMWTVATLLRSADTALAERFESGETRVALAAQGLFSPVAGLGPVPWGPVAERVLSVEPLEDGSARLLLAESRSLPWSRGSALDPSLPVWTAGGAGGEEIARIDGGPLARARATYLLVQAAEMVGAGSWLTAETVRYLKQREQFGRVLASYQALQHRAARMFVTVETLRALVMGCAAATGLGVADLARLALLVKGYAGERCTVVANEALQLHGGIAVTWECPVHWNLQRILLRSRLGVSAREAIVRSGRGAIGRRSLLSLPPGMGLAR